MLNKKFNNKPNECTKTEDGRTIWLGRSVAVAAEILLFDEESYGRCWNPLVLIVKRGPASLGEPGKWCFPCGYLDWNESGRDAAIRESFEEGGVDVSSNNYDITSFKNRVFQPETNMPWYVDSSPRHHRQNVTLHFGFVRKLLDEDAIPEVSSSYSEAGEISDIKWVRSNSIINHGNEYDMAFDHDLVLHNFIMKLQGCA